MSIFFLSIYLGSSYLCFLEKNKLAEELNSRFNFDLQLKNIYNIVKESD